MSRCDQPNGNAILGHEEKRAQQAHVPSISPPQREAAAFDLSTLLVDHLIW